MLEFDVECLISKFSQSSTQLTVTEIVLSTVRICTAHCYHFTSAGLSHFQNASKNIQILGLLFIDVTSSNVFVGRKNY